MRSCPRSDACVALVRCPTTAEKLSHVCLCGRAASIMAGCLMFSVGGERVRPVARMDDEGRTYNLLGLVFSSTALRNQIFCRYQCSNSIPLLHRSTALHRCLLHLMRKDLDKCIMAV
ncbi:hypothetical protein KP509_23G002900 [Ceratopteris richardii]|uniref:Uncharacterized protein n=1 Tax=Ceratopteris richardii TaxID=49495 RepID=A0A8T2RZJ2_CERRI|nr:hypothetical protein KP509_23G002900 [Ceratopteris richardii]